MGFVFVSFTRITQMAFAASRRHMCLGLRLLAGYGKRPGSHGLHFLTVAMALVAAARSIGGDRGACEKDTEEDQILTELQYIRTRINASSSILTDKEKTGFFFVIIPEEMILIDTAKAADLFAKFDVPIMGYVVNRVVPRELLQQNIPPYLKNRIEMQDKYLEQIKTTFGQQVAAHVPELERDVTGLEMIRRLAEIMYGVKETQP